MQPDRRRPCDQTSAQRTAGQEAEAHEATIGRRWPWLLPLAAGIFLGAALIEVFPDALALVGRPAWLWALVGLVVFVGIRTLLDELGRRGMATVATLGIWLHSFLEGAVTASSYGVSLIVGLITSIGLLLHLVPEIGAVIAVLTAAGLSLRQALIRNGITWVMIVAGFLVIFFWLPGLSPGVLGAALAFGAGGFLYLASVSWHERRWGVVPSVIAVIAGILIVAVGRLLAG